MPCLISSPSARTTIVSRTVIEPSSCTVMWLWNRRMDSRASAPEADRKVPAASSAAARTELETDLIAGFDVERGLVRLPGLDDIQHGEREDAARGRCRVGGDVPGQT